MLSAMATAGCCNYQARNDRVWVKKHVDRPSITLSQAMQGWELRCGGEKGRSMGFPECECAGTSAASKRGLIVHSDCRNTGNLPGTLSI